MKKVLVLLSGGIDGTICLALAIKEFKRKNVFAVSFDYGQKNRRELNSAVAIAKHYKVAYEEIDISSLFQHSNSSMLNISTLDIPHDNYETQNENLAYGETVSTNVPFRNGLMLSACASLAISKKIDEIYYGIHLEEGIAQKLYPDCSEQFNDSMNKAIYIGSGKRVTIVAPLCLMKKAEIIKLGHELNVPYELTWTCYDKKEKPCGKCTACVDRLKAFNQNGILDPVKYQKEEK